MPETITTKCTETPIREVFNTIPVENILPPVSNRRITMFEKVKRVAQFAVMVPVVVWVCAEYYLKGNKNNDEE